MIRQLQIKNGVVVGEWVGDKGEPKPPDASWIFLDVTDRDEGKIGMLYDDKTDTFSLPPAPPDYGVNLSPRDFLMRFTSTERKAIRAAGKVDEDIADWYELALSSGEFIRLSHPLTIAGVGFLVTRGLITAERRAVILGQS